MVAAAAVVLPEVAAADMAAVVEAVAEAGVAATAAVEVAAIGINRFKIKTHARRR